jgi:hypothetical protein
LFEKLEEKGEGLKIESNKNKEMKNYKIYTMDSCTWTKHKQNVGLTNSTTTKASHITSLKNIHNN